MHILTISNFAKYYKIQKAVIYYSLDTDINTKPYLLDFKYRASLKMFINCKILYYFHF